MTSIGYGDIELIMRHALEKLEDGIEIGGTYYNNLRYADDVDGI